MNLSEDSRPFRSDLSHSMLFFHVKRSFSAKDATAEARGGYPTRPEGGRRSNFFSPYELVIHT